jgi:hypothetical protein
MADTFVRFDVFGLREAALRFDKFPQIAHDKLLAEITELTDVLEGRVISGMPRKTGKLASAVIKQVFDDQPRKIAGWVSIDREEVRKAAALEYGATGQANLKAHSAKLDHYWSKKLEAAVTVFVKAHTRQLNLVAERFMRNAVVGLSADAITGMNRAVDEAIKESEG